MLEKVEQILSDAYTAETSREDLASVVGQTPRVMGGDDYDNHHITMTRADASTLHC